MLLSFNRLIPIFLNRLLFLFFVFFIINFTFETFSQKFNFFFKLLNFNKLILIFLDCLVFKKLTQKQDNLTLKIK